jgi:pyridoxal 5'-phosphate synthase pdxT subunit
MKKKIVGILALQGDFVEHAAAIKRCGGEARLVKNAAELSQCDSLIIPGGESTTMGIIAASIGLIEPLKKFIASDAPVWGTCAGLILLANKVVNQKQDGQATLGGLHITASRNYYGRQIQSFTTKIAAPTVAPEPISVMFIRAPGITRVGAGVNVLATSTYDGHDIPVAVRQNNIVGTSFHIELGSDPKFHQYFLSF